MKEKYKPILGAVLCIAVILIYVVFIDRRMFPPQPPQPAGTEQPAQPTPEQPVEPSQPREPGITPEQPREPGITPETPREVSELPPQELKEFTVESGPLNIELTNRGAAIKSVTLKDFETFPENPEKLKLLTEIEEGQDSLVLIDELGEANYATTVWKHDSQVQAPAGYVRAEQFSLPLPKRGIEIVKTYLFPDNQQGARDRHIVLRVAVRNMSDTEQKVQYRLRTAAGIVPEPTVPPKFPLELQESRDIEAAIGVHTNGAEVKLQTFAPRKVKKESRIIDSPVFGGVKNRYFTAVVKPGQPDIIKAEVKKLGQFNLTTELLMSSVRIQPGKEEVREYMFVVAPKLPAVLNQYKEERLDILVEYGWPKSIAKGLTAFLHWIYRFVPNYGVAIIILTFLIRVVLHPLSLKSQKSMHKMAKVQPLLNAAKEKYKHDKRAQGMETMRIMKEQGMNPLGGCLPMLVQLPILIALWRAFYLDGNLRHAPFMLWINDLAAPDNLITLPFYLPIIGASINVLPILGAAAIMVQQSMQPKNPDPQMAMQQKMMMFMPIIFAFMLYSMPAGLMLYFLTSTLFGIAEYKYIKHKLDKLDLITPAPAPEQKKDQKKKKK